jgi:hypothetical protein
MRDLGRENHAKNNWRHVCVRRFRASSCASIFLCSDGERHVQLVESYEVSDVIKVNSENSCVLSYGSKSFTLKPGASYSLQVMYVAGCSSLQVAWDVSGGGSNQPFSGTLTYNHNYREPGNRTTAGVGIDYSAQMKLKGASFRVACGNDQIICYRPNKIATVLARGPGASIGLMSDAVYGMELFGGTSPIRQGL